MRKLFNYSDIFTAAFVIVLFCYTQSGYRMFFDADETGRQLKQSLHTCADVVFIF